MHKFRVITLRLNLFIVLIEGMFVLWQYLQKPSEPQSALLWGYSALRLTLFFIIGFGILLFLFLLVKSAKDPTWIQKFENILGSVLEQGMILWALFLMLGMIYLTLFLSDHQLGSFASYREAARPLLAWFGVVCLQIVISYILIRSYEKKLMREYRDIFIPASIMLGLLGGLTGIIAITRIGLTPDAVYWQDAGVPILFSQVVFVTLIGALFHFLETRYAVFRSSWSKIFVILAIWCTACLLWLGQPLTPSYNSLKPVPPNYQPYPFGDALQYDVTAHEFLAGKQIPGDFWSKPLYSLFLALLHLVSGEDYDLLVIIQIMVLAVIPVFVYLIVARLGNRPAGVIAAMLFILREKNGVALSNVIQVSNVKLLMSDVFTMGLVSILILLIIDWLHRARAGKLLLMGAILGLLVLTRGHPILLFPFLLCVIFFVPKVHARLIWKNLFLFTAGFLLTLLPWFARIYLETGKFSFQSPGSPYASQMADLYSLTPTVISREKVESRLPGETDLGFSERMNRQVFEFIVQHPIEAAKFVSSHYFHNSIFSFMYLPYSLKLEGLRNYVDTELFWKRWSGSLHPYNWLFLGVNVLLLGLGTGAMWKKKQQDALVPLFIGIGYNLSVSVGRLSGWRFIQPADWITLIYYSVGLVQLLFILEFLAGRINRPYPQIENADTAENEQKLNIWKGVGLLIPFLLTSIFLMWGHKLTLNNISSDTENELVNTLESVDPEIQFQDLKAFLLTDGAVILSGESLYPTFWEANAGAFNIFWPGYSPSPYPRLGFYLLGKQSVYTVLPIKLSPRSFPGGSKVIVVGCKTEANYIDALAILLRTEQPTLYLREPFPGWYCPIPEP